MTDIFHVAPDFSTKPFSHLLPSLDKSLVTTSDLITLDALDVAKRAQVPIGEVKKLQNALLLELHNSLGYGEPAGESSNDDADPEPALIATRPPQSRSTWQLISTLDAGLDEMLGGGIPTEYLTEITGESGSGKTQFLLTLLLSSQLASPSGVSRSSIYVSTEATLSTPRLAQILRSHPRLSSLPESQKPSLKRILSIQTPDLESQEHILRYQLPVAIERQNIGLVVLDSVAANYRAEFEKDERSGQPSRSSAAAMAQRSVQLTQLGSLLRDIAYKYKVAVVVANQVADRFSDNERSATNTAGPSRNTSFNSQVSSTHAPVTPRGGGAPAQVAVPERPAQPSIALTTSDPMALDHQQRWFTGWGDMLEPTSLGTHTPNLKTPSLGLVWTNQLACRIALVKHPIYSKPNPLNDLIRTLEAQVENTDEGDQSSDIVRWRRWAKVVFAPWVAPTAGKGCEFEIKGSGIMAVDD